MTNGMIYDVQWLLRNDIPRNLSADEYQLCVDMLKDAYRSSFLQVNQNQSQYNEHIKELKATIIRLEEITQEQKKITSRYQNKLIKAKLSFKERLFGKIDLSKLTAPD